MTDDAVGLLAQVRACTLCSDHLPMGPRPVLQWDASARILLAAQAPGRKVHESGVPFDDASGERLRHWLGVPTAVFYDPRCFAIVPMGFCYPGKGRSGDLPPRPECAAHWRGRLLSPLRQLRLTLVMGQYAKAYHLPSGIGPDLTSAVRSWRALEPGVMALPHPSPRNNPWFKRHPWFEAEVVPALRVAVQRALEGTESSVRTPMVAPQG